MNVLALRRPMNNMENGLLIALLSGVGAAFLHAVSAIFNAILKRKTDAGTADVDKYEALVKAQTDMREEYRADALRLHTELREQAKLHQKEMADILKRQSELEAHIMRQNLHMESMTLQMQDALRHSDTKLMIRDFERIVRDMREWSERHPAIGLPEITANRVYLEGSSE